MSDPLIFIHINKTGGSSIRHALKITHQARHLTARESRRRYHEYDDAFVFTIVRNPYDRVVSLYHYQKWMNYNSVKQSGITFKNWVEQVFKYERAPYYHAVKYYQPCTWWLDDEVDAVFKFEQWDEMIAELEHVTGSPLIVPHLKRTHREHYRAYFESEESRRIVQAKFEPDFERFGYEF